jgi:single-strand DNA-binding protein
MIKQKQILIFGKLGKESELKYTPKQTPICHLAVAENVEGQGKPNWHKVIVWGKQGETCKVTLKKGSGIFIRGKINEREYKNDLGEVKKSIEINADTIGATILT